MPANPDPEKVLAQHAEKQKNAQTEAAAAAGASEASKGKRRADRSRQMRRKVQEVPQGPGEGQSGQEQGLKDGWDPAAVAEGSDWVEEDEEEEGERDGMGGVGQTKKGHEIFQDDSGLEPFFTIGDLAEIMHPLHPRLPYVYDNIVMHGGQEWIVDSYQR